MRTTRLIVCVIILLVSVLARAEHGGTGGSSGGRALAPPPPPTAAPETQAAATPEPKRADDAAQISEMEADLAAALDAANAAVNLVNGVGTAFGARGEVLNPVTASVGFTFGQSVTTTSLRTGK